MWAIPFLSSGMHASTGIKLDLLTAFRMSTSSPIETGRPVLAITLQTTEISQTNRCGNSEALEVIESRLSTYRRETDAKPWQRFCTRQSDPGQSVDHKAPISNTKETYEANGSWRFSRTWIIMSFSVRNKVINNLQIVSWKNAWIFENFANLFSKIVKKSCWRSATKPEVERSVFLDLKLTIEPIFPISSIYS